jgi:hypothetical protein
MTLRVKQVVYGKVYHNDEPENRFRIWCNKYHQFERSLSEEELEGRKFLCKVDKSLFVSPIKWNDSYGWYVDNVRGKICYRVEELDELYLVEL